MEYFNINSKLISIFSSLIIISAGIFAFLFFMDFADDITVSGSAIIVSESGNGTYTSIQNAIDSANPNDIIRVYNGTYSENLVVNKKLTIIGNGSANTTINGGNKNNVINITANEVSITGFCITHNTNSSRLEYHGIYMEWVIDVVIMDNNFTNNKYGIFINRSNSNDIVNNTCYNNMDGMVIMSANSNQILNNRCLSSELFGIHISNSNNNLFKNNNLRNSREVAGLYYVNCDNNIIENNICENNTSYGIFLGGGSEDNKILNNVCNNNDAGAGIEIYNSDKNQIENNFCNSNFITNININRSSSSILINNTCINSTKYGGISLIRSPSNTMLKNIMKSCSIFIQSGEKTDWNTQNIDISNTVNGKSVYYWKNVSSGYIPSDAGEAILANCSNIEINELMINNTMYSILLGFSNSININNNTLKNNFGGIFTYSSSNLEIVNNKLSFNSYAGIITIKSNNNFIKKNNCSKNQGVFGSGILLQRSAYNQLINNTCNKNFGNAIELLNSKNNNIEDNNLSLNKIAGIDLTSSSNSNSINSNLLQNNGFGIFINNSNSSIVYYNNIINNSIQASELGISNNNAWDNDKGEGNFWSDYTGLDNGANGRYAGDGIGDTELPHLGLDHYPFVNTTGWLYPGIPRLFDPGKFDSDGSFDVEWYPIRGVSEYILEEDTNPLFKDPKVVYRGSNKLHYITRNPNGTYYYRLKANNDRFESTWSNIVDMSVDWPPSIPQNLTVSAFPDGNSLNISWSPNLVDTKEYDLYYKIQDESNDTWIRLGIFIHPFSYFNHTDLLDGSKYYYKVKARDHRDQDSDFSGIIEGIPADKVAPDPPKDLSIISTSNDSISLTWTPNKETDLEGYFIFRSKLSNPSSWITPIGILPAGTEVYIDSGLAENTTYFYVIIAFDEVPNNSSYSNIVNGTTLLDPYAPLIISDVSDIFIYEDTIDNKSIILTKWFFDKNKDPLEFYCSGNIHLSIQIYQQNGKVTLIPEKNWCGFENLTFYCSDGYFNISKNLTITVLPVTDPPGPAKIISPENGFEIKEGVGLTLTGICSDPDIPYGDELIYTWSSNLVGDLGSGEELNGIKVNPGEHTITLRVTDSSGNSSYASINILVKELEVISTPVNNLNIAIIFIVILIIIVLVIFFVFRKRRSEPEKTSKPSDISKSTLDGATVGSSTGTGGHGLVTTSDLYKYQKKDISPTLDQSSQESRTATIRKGKIPTVTTSSSTSHLGAINRKKQELLKFQSKLVGRDTELNVLKEYLTRAESNQGNTLLIHGEAGIGKTRLVNELKNIAVQRGFEVLTSNCMYESLSPYMPFNEALRTGGLDYLFEEESPRIEGVYLVSDSGMLISEVIRQDTRLNPVLFASMLTAVGNFVKESLSILSGEEKDGALNSLGFENYRIVIESGSNINLAVILTGKENKYLISDLKKIISKINQDYGLVLKDWDGVVDNIGGIEGLINPLVTSGKYDGIQHKELDPKLRRNMLFNSVSNGLINKSKNTPILLCMEDLHWADPSTLALIHHVTRNSKNSKLLIIGTYRPEELTTKDGIAQPLLETMHLMDREELLNNLELPRLSEECTDEMVTSLLGGKGVTTDVRTIIFQETEGNPLFMIELIKFIADEKIIVHSQDLWQLSSKLEDISLPPKIFNVIDRRLSRLEKKYREILEYASVIGETFSSSVLGTALEKPRLELLTALRELEQKHHLIFSNDGLYQFSHAKIKEVVYSKIPSELRMEYHGIIAGSIEKLNRDNLNSVVETIAYHYNQSQNSDKAASYMQRAAQKARLNYSNSEAIKFYNDALGLVRDSLKRIEIYDSLGEIYDLMGDYDNSTEMYNRALDISADPKKNADLKTKLGLLYLKKSDYPKSIQQSSEALELIKNDTQPETAVTYETLGHTYHRMGDYDSALKNHKKSLEIREKLNESSGIATSLKNIGTILLDKRDYNNALKHFNKSLELFQKIKNSDGIQQCLNNIGTLYFNQGDYDSAFEYYDKTLKLIEISGDQSSIAILLLNLGQSQLQIGETSKAITNLQRSLKISKENDLLMVTACNYWVMSEVYLKTENLTRALDYCNRAYNTSKELGAKEIIAALKRVFGIIYSKQKKWNISIENFDDSIKLYQEIGNNKELGDTYYEYGLMLSSMGDPKSAKENLKMASEIFKKLKLISKREKANKAIESIGK